MLRILLYVCDERNSRKRGKSSRAFLGCLGERKRKMRVAYPLDTGTRTQWRCLRRDREKREREREEGKAFDSCCCCWKRGRGTHVVYIKEELAAPLFPVVAALSGREWMVRDRICWHRHGCLNDSKKRKVRVADAMLWRYTFALGRDLQALIIEFLVQRECCKQKTRKKGDENQRARFSSSPISLPCPPKPLSYVYPF